MRDPYPDDTSMVRILVTNMSAVESKIIDQWYKEIKFYQRSLSNYTHHQNVGHYTTQVVSADCY